MKFLPDHPRHRQSSLRGHTASQIPCHAWGGELFPDCPLEKGFGGREVPRLHCYASFTLTTRIAENVPHLANVEEKFETARLFREKSPSESAMTDFWSQKSPSCPQMSDFGPRECVKKFRHCLTIQEKCLPKSGHLNPPKSGKVRQPTDVLLQSEACIDR